MTDENQLNTSLLEADSTELVEIGGILDKVQDVWTKYVSHMKDQVVFVEWVDGEDFSSLPKDTIFQLVSNVFEGADQSIGDILNDEKNPEGTFFTSDQGEFSADDIEGANTLVGVLVHSEELDSSFGRNIFLYDPENDVEVMAICLDKEASDVSQESMLFLVKRPSTGQLTVVYVLPSDDEGNYQVEVSYYMDIADSLTMPDPFSLDALTDSAFIWREHSSSFPLEGQHNFERDFAF